MKEKDWEQQLRERMDTWQEPVSDALWDNIEKRLSPRRPRRWWVVAAAAAVLAVFCLGGFYRHILPFASDNDSGVDAGDYVVQLPPTFMETDMQTHIQPTKQYVRKPTAVVKPHLPVENKVACGGNDAAVGSDNGISSDSQDSREAEISENTCPDAPPAAPDDDRSVVVRHGSGSLSSGGNALLADVRSVYGKSNDTRRFSFGVTMSDNLAGNNVNSEPVRMMSAPMRPSGVTDTPPAYGDSDGGSPMYMYKSSSITDHKLPVSFGLLVNYRLRRRFSLESGLTYTYLRTDFTQQVGQHSTVDIQRLHYVGIPLHASLDIVRLRPLTLYYSMGVDADFCVSASMTTASRRRSISRDRVQFSLFASLGIRCAVGSGFNVFGELGEHYAIDNGNMLINYFDANKHYGVLRMGINYDIK